jgi:hypothetical protein
MIHGRGDAVDVWCSRWRPLLIPTTRAHPSILERDVENRHFDASSKPPEEFVLNVPLLKLNSFPISYSHNWARQVWDFVSTRAHWDDNNSAGTILYLTGSLGMPCVSRDNASCTWQDGPYNASRIYHRFLDRIVALPVRVPIHFPTQDILESKLFYEWKSWLVE